MQREDVMMLVQTVKDGSLRATSRTDSNALSSTGSHLPPARLPLESPRPHTRTPALHHVHELVGKTATL